jgi:radical SAM superfamily enzyme YgiQ (UPF0313 family)
MPTRSLHVVLIQPHTPADGPFERLGRSDLPPLGLLYLAAALERAGHRVTVFDLNLALRTGRVVRRIARERPDVVGIGTLAPCQPVVEDLARRLRPVMAPGALLIAGGADATTRTALYTGGGQFDAVLVGEAERSLVELCAAFPRIPRIPGVIPAGDTGCAPPARIVADDAAFPARHLLPLRRYRGGPAYKRGRYTASIFTHRGCPYRCTFCEQGVHAGKVRFRSAGSIFAELQQLRRDHGIRDIRFIDDVLISRRSVLWELIELLLDSGERFDWLCTGRIDLADDELLRAMRRAGCYRVEYGIESGSDRILAMTDKGFDVAAAEAAVQRTRAAGIETIANFILGFPTETEDEIEQTVQLALRLDAEYAIFFPFCPYQGAEITREFGLRWGPEYPAFRAPSPHYPVDTDRLMERVDQAYSRFYFRPGYVARRLTAVRNGWIYWDLGRMAAAHAARRGWARMAGR